MQIEYEATFYPVKKTDVRKKLKRIGAKLIKPEFLQKRCVFELPIGHEIQGGWLRVRDEGDKITMSLKVVNGDHIENQKEICLQVDNFNQAILLLEMIGCKNIAYQETRRELWNVDGVDVCLDKWPWLEPFVEIEGKTKAEVKRVSNLLGFNYRFAKFCSADTLFSEKYKMPKDFFNNHTPRLVFKGKNPFVPKKAG